MRTDPALTPRSGDPYAGADRTVGLGRTHPIDAFDPDFDSWPTDDLVMARAVTPEGSLLEDVGKLVRAITQLVTSIPAANQVYPTAAAASSGGQYSTANLPSGISARAFNEAIRRKRVPFAAIGGRNIVRASDWDNYIATRVTRRATPTRTNATDDELLGSAGSRPRGRR
jgi:hypothetical protein